MKIERVCNFCKQENPPDDIFESDPKVYKNIPKAQTKKAVISCDNVSDFILCHKMVYHRNCFLRKLDIDSRKKTTLIYTALVNESKDDFIKRLSSETVAHFKSLFIKDELYDFIREFYDITVVPSCVFTKLQSIYDGSFKGMSVGIPPEHLLDMWKRKADELSKIANRNITKGKTMPIHAQVLYDLSVLVGKYDSYLRWLNKQKILEADAVIDKDKLGQQGKLDMSIIEKQTRVANETHKKDEIDGLLEELF